MALHEIEEILRERLAGTLPGLDAQLRFAPHGVDGARGTSPQTRGSLLRSCSSIQTRAARRCR